MNPRAERFVGVAGVALRKEILENTAGSTYYAGDNVIQAAQLAY
jgi:hypothetical protein